MSLNELRAAEIKAKLQARDDHLRESWVRAMEARLVREELEKCQKGEGVNHYENCKWLSEKYLTMLKENRVQGYKQIDV
ncbi:NADH-ubiquinone oxidoreductase subunit, mitochondrial [Hypsizygus marmoreus]|uniref:NADH-ubiquinone oxidoreductase subunit, mitochondrial n=1 Tax=Hypsizygus marmoreus TaxID=39966 RepID=A0A369JXU6_HYPMA|nr:NADH-ubiquinone oxidoreductase subunit, mitochondrial [Hypsizygus marmoreus]